VLRQEVLVPVSRRSFLSDAAAAAWLASLLPAELAAQAMQHASQTASRTTAGEKYWSNLYATGADYGTPRDSNCCVPILR